MYEAKEQGLAGLSPEKSTYVPHFTLRSLHVPHILTRCPPTSRDGMDCMTSMVGQARLCLCFVDDRKLKSI